MENQPDYRERDVATLRALGSFFSLMGVLVLIGSFEAVDNRPALIVSCVSGSTLFCVGMAMLWKGRRMQKQTTEKT